MVKGLLYEGGGFRSSPMHVFNLPCSQRLETGLLIGGDMK